MGVGFGIAADKIFKKSALATEAASIIGLAKAKSSLRAATAAAAGAAAMLLIHRILWL